ncbi:MAG: SLBB domain-containing protein [Alphaproteobacteria bacterium]|nr:SLBB domain-containing protein [Alphaproteobacteria bacterium]
MTAVVLIICLGIGFKAYAQEDKSEQTIPELVSPIASVADEVILRTGDMILIDFPGESAFGDPFSIDQDGFLSLPEIGRIHMSGKDWMMGVTTIQLSLSTAYRDVEDISITLKERQLFVTVLGYVKDPGPVQLIPHSTVQMAIQAAGGLAQGAQLDKIQVRRLDEVIIFDYKKYLDTGDDSIIPDLKPLDVVFVPASPLTGNVQVEFDARTLTSAGDGGGEDAVKVFGEVHRPGSFKYKLGASVIDMMMRAGGVTRYAGIEQIRIISKGEPYPFNMREYMDTGNPELMPEIGMGDTIFVPQVTEQVKTGSKIIYVMGEVFHPGAYETKKGVSLFDVLANAGGPTRFAETRQIRILKKDGDVIRFDLMAFTERKNDLVLPMIEAGDAIFVPEKADMNEKSWLKIGPDRAVMVIGSVVRPGRYEWADEMSFLDLIAHAGGPGRNGDTSKVSILPPPEEKGKVSPVIFDFSKFMNEGGNVSDLPVIKSGYTIQIPELPKDPSDNRSQWTKQDTDRSIFILGAMLAPGRYAFNDNLTFMDIFSAAQGPSPNADLHNIRISHRGEGKARITKVNLSKYFETGDERLLPKVRPADVIYIPHRTRQWIDTPKEETVRVLGAVANPGRYEFKNNMTILDLLAEAGGPRSDAWQEKIVVVNLGKGQPKASSFDLVGFAKSGDFLSLPVVRVGDTIYVPDKSQSNRAKFRENLKDTMGVISLIATIAGI